MAGDWTHVPSLANDHPLFRDGLPALLTSVANAGVVGEAATGEEAVARALELQPDVVVIDLHMPDMNGIETTRRIVESSRTSASSRMPRSRAASR